MKPGVAAVPQPVARVLGSLPGYPGSVLFATGLNVVIAQHLNAELRNALDGKTLRIRVTDAKLAFDFGWNGNRFAAVRIDAEPDLTIGASAADFLLLAQRREDPDTLFFSRRLSMEGDTELGLMLKNTIDAIDFAPFDPARLAPSRVFARFRSFIKA